MRQLWAPWRLEYIQQPQSEGCFLCTAAGSTDDAASLVVARGRRCFVLLNRFPYNVGHAMVVPVRHLRHLGDLDDAELLELFRLTERTIRVMQQVFRAEGFNVGMNRGRVAGAGVEDHLHVHVVPRWAGDTNFMPVLGDVKVMPEHLQRTRERLAQGFTASMEEETPSPQEQA